MDGLQKDQRALMAILPLSKAVFCTYFNDEVILWEMNRFRTRLENNLLSQRILQYRSWLLVAIPEGEKWQLYGTGSTRGKQRETLVEENGGRVQLKCVGTL